MKKMTLKKVVSLLCAIVLVVGLVPAAFADAAFTVSDATWTNVKEGYTTAPSATYTVTNTSDAEATYNFSLASGTDFTVSPASATVAAGSTASVTVTLGAEKTVNTYADTLTVTDGTNNVTKSISVDVEEHTYTISLTAGSEWPSAALAHGTYTAQEVIYTVKNTGTGSVEGLTAAVLNSSDFTVGELSKTALAPNEEAIVKVTFPAGKAIGEYEGILMVSGNHGAQAATNVAVSVKAASAMSVAIKNGAWSSSDLIAGKYQAQTVTYEISNTGAAALNNLKVTLSDVNPASSDCFTVSSVASTLAAGGKATFTVTFKDGLAAASYSAKVTVSATGADDVVINLAQTVKSKVSVTFKSAESSAELGKVEIASGGKASYTGTTPVKASTSTYTYTFAGWTTNAAAAVSNGNVANSALTIVDLSKQTFAVDTTLYAVFTKHVTYANSAYYLEGDCTSASGATLDEIKDSSTGQSLYYQLAYAVTQNLGTTTTLGKVVFGNSGGTTYGNLYVNSSKTATVGGRSFYFSYSALGDYPLSNVFFAPSSAYEGDFQIMYTAYDAYGNSVSGVMTIHANASGKGDINYDVSHDDTVTLSSADFAAYLASKMPYSTMSYVKFSAPSISMSSYYGSFYYNYGKLNQTQLSNYNLQSYSFYRTGSSYLLDNVTFVPGSYTGDYVVSVPFVIYTTVSSAYLTGTMTINVTDGGVIEYKVNHNGSVTFKSSDFTAMFAASYPTLQMKYVRFGTPSPGLNSYYGNMYYDYSSLYQTPITASSLSSYYFYANAYSTGAYGSSYLLDKLTFVPGSMTTDYTVTIPYIAYYDATRYVSGNVVIKVADGAGVEYTVSHKGKVTLNPADFEAYLKKSYSTASLRWVEFGNPNITLGSYYGNIYYNYGTTNQAAFSNTTLQAYEFYAAYAGYGDYPLSSLTFVPGSYSSDYTVSIPFTAYYSEAYYVTGVMNIKVTEGNLVGVDIVYNTKRSTAVSITAADIEKFFNETYPNVDLNYVVFDGVPSTGDFYYNYGAMGSYGVKSAVKLTNDNVKNYYFYNVPTSTSNYSLHELSYLPYGAGYTVTIPFTAYYNLNNYVSGTIAICVSEKAANEAYMVTTKNTAVAINAAYINSEVSTAASQTVSYIQFLTLPAATEGTLYYDYRSASSYNHKVTPESQYVYSAGTYLISKVSFVPATGFTGNVAIPYAAYNTYGNLLYVGEMSIGVVTTKYYYSDAPANAWYYKYVTELSDAKVVNGYPNGTFKPGNNVSYGEALKLILVATGYGEQPRVSAKHNWASGYLNKAVSLGIYTKAEAAKINLDASISRLEVARVAALAMKLSTASISSPFSDTTNGSVLALYQAGIIEGSFNTSGLRYFYPSNSIQRSEISAIIWRINNYS